MKFISSLCLFFLLRASKIKFNTFLELGSTEAIKKTVEANLGIGCLSYTVVKDKVKSKELYMFRLNEGRIERDLFLILHSDKFVSNNMKAFIEYSKKYISK